MATGKRVALWVFFVLLVIFLMPILSGILFPPLQVIFHLAAGWIFFLSNVIPSVRVFWPSIITGVLAFSFVIIGMHSAVKWFRKQKSAGQADNRPAWKFRWSLALAIMVIVTFVAGIAMVGLIHQLYWFSQDPPAFQAERSFARGLCMNNLRLIDHAKEVWAIKNNATNGQIIASTPEAIWRELDPFLDGTNILCCPDLNDTHYNYNAIGVPPTCPSGAKLHVYEPAQ